MFWNAHRTVLDKTLVLCALSSHASLALTTKCELLLKAFHLNQAVLERTLSHWALCWDWIAKARNSFSLGNAAEFSFPLTLRPSGFFQHVCLNFQTDLSSADLRRFVYLTRNSYSWEQQQTFYLTTQQVYENNVLRCWENSIWNHEIRRIQWSFKWQKKKKKKRRVTDPIPLKGVITVPQASLNGTAKINRLSKHLDSHWLTKQKVPPAKSHY